MPDSRDPNHDPRQNAAWQAAQQWRERARQNNAGGPLSGLKMLLAWLLFGAMMIVAVILGLFFLLLGWALMPLLRYRMKKRMEQMRADRAEDIGGSHEQTRYGETHYSETHHRETRYREHPSRESPSRESPSRESRGGSRDQQVLEGDYEVKASPRRDDEAN
ncbi:hypothetical protein [Halomonas urumqiensis]|uniref:Uncharacterized protein n=1 Tax=Halomonas urumqiensis TaxID=1684789 RepID=A0A2N7UJB2_9GAMM|nr:hypothetical protein [Halomonas urumqiensis]PMR80490.1 hypothetical protein C1H70_08530 [Halomonas urumqiensis]PTB01665.1 hypothetical protein C6V82_13345 [Halomonas urumqiensis]GHE22249.1 hypothetical protein GCM10017767_27700 [Halomonas urumqiensis]